MILPRAVALVFASGNPQNELDVASDREGCDALLSVDGKVALWCAQDVNEIPMPILVIAPMTKR